MNRFISTIIPAICILIISNSCGIYSFSGASISPTIKTISIGQILNESGNGPANLSQTFTNKLKDYFQQNTSLILVPSNGDLQFEGNIVGYNFTPVAPVASQDPNRPDVAGAMRLTITVKMSYVNVQDDTYNFNKDFSYYSDYDPQRQNLSSVEPQLIEDIFDNITKNIFTSSVANW